MADATAGLAGLDIPAIVNTIAASFRRFPREDVEEAVMEAAFEVTALAKREPLEGPAHSLVAQRARWRMLSRAEKALREVSLDAIRDDPEEPREMAISDDDVEARDALLDVDTNPVLRDRRKALEAGCSRTMARRGAFSEGQAVHPQALVEKARAMAAKGSSYAAIAREIGCNVKTATAWCKERSRAIDTPGWDEDRCIRALRDHFERHGKMPAAKRLSEHPDLPSFGALIERFGNYNGALRAAGLPTRISRSPWEPDEVLQAFRIWAEQHRHWPSCAEFEAPGSGLPGKAAVHRCLGTMSMAKVRALAESEQLS